jgi:hypothetical protein
MHVQHALEMARVKQSAVTRRLYSKVYAELLAELVRKEEYTVAAQVRSAPADKQLARWLKGGLYLSLHCRLSPSEMFQALRQRLQVPEFIGMNAVCGCKYKVRLSDDQNHLMHCQAAQREMTFRHDLIRGAVAKLCKECVGPAGKVDEEQPFERRGELSACIVDIIVVTPEGAEHFIDVAVVNQCAPAYVFGSGSQKFVEKKAGSGFVKGSAAEQKRVAKSVIALKCLSAAQMAGFADFSVETTGVMGTTAEAFLQAMEQCHAARIGDGAPRLYRKLYVKFLLELGMILARGTARILRATRSKVRHRAREGAVAMDEFDGFFDAAEEAPGLGVGFEDEDEHARLDAGILNLDVGAGNMGAAVEGAEDAAVLAAAGEVGHPPFIFPHGDVADGVGGPLVH